MIDEVPEDVRRAVRTPDKASELVLAPSHRAGDFHSHALDCPFVFRVDGRVGMTVVGWDGTGYQTGLSWLGEDGRWSAPHLVFPRDPGSRHRRHNSALTSILSDDALDGAGELVRVDGWFLATFHAYPDPGYEAGPGVVGFARSRDLESWEEVGDLLEPAPGPAWDAGGLYKSWLMRDGEGFRVFYNAKDLPAGAWREQTGAATSLDLTGWRRVTDRPLLENGPAGSVDERFASDPCVLRLGDVWVMFYFGLSADGVARELFAVSDDLLHWRKGDEVLVDVGPAGSPDSRYAHKPAVITRAGRLEHYYCGVRPLDEPVDIGGYRQTELRGIAVARSAR